METNFSSHDMENGAIRCYKSPNGKGVYQRFGKEGGRLNGNEPITHFMQRFDGLDEVDRIKFVDILLDRCTVNLLRYIKYEATRRLRYTGKATMTADGRQDFTRTLPKALCLKIFSYLSPKTLCRCAQVCGYWKFLSESNELWEIKCRRLHWVPDNSLLAAAKLRESGIEPLALWKTVYEINVARTRTKVSSGYVAATGNNRKDAVQSRLQKTRATSNHFESSVLKTRETAIERRANGNNTFLVMEQDEYRGIMPNMQDHSRPDAYNPKAAHRKANTYQNGYKQKPLAPWRPSALHPEDTHYEKFGANNSIARARADKFQSQGRRFRSSSAQGSRSAFQSSHLQSKGVSQQNFVATGMKPPIQFMHQQHDEYAEDEAGSGAEDAHEYETDEFQHEQQPIIRYSIENVHQHGRIVHSNYSSNGGGRGENPNALAGYR